MIQVLNGPTYSNDDRPPFWGRQKRLLISEINQEQLERAPLAAFPLIEDFEVRLENDTDYSFGYHLCFMSVSRGYLAHFLWWDHVENDLIRDTFAIPLGDFSHPFDDVHQGWEIVIAAKDEFVYALEGTADGLGFHTWFKVRQDRYLAEWQKAIQACRETFMKQP
ncbi:MAG: hypothetical protein ABI690_14905 [Chloroflexota bacterium]